VITVLEELFAYVGFDDADRVILRELHPRLEPHFAAIAERFYQTINANPGAARVLAGPAQVERLRLTLIDWMSTGLLGPHDERFYEKRSRIGRRHVAIGLAQRYMITAMSVVRIAYHDLVTELYGADAPTVMRSVNKLLDLELAIMVEHYQLDTEEKLISRERGMQADRILAMQTLSAGLAHELRNPLNAARLQLELLERRLKKQVDPHAIEPAQLAQGEMQRLTNLLNDFLAFARPPELHTERRDVAAIVRTVIELERLGAERKGVDLALVACPDELIAEVDAPKIHQVVMNLVRNAVEAVPAGGHVAVELVSHGAMLSIRVQDDGPGIPQSIRQRIYEPFFSTKESGTGLGMSIVHSLVMLHDGSIDLETGSSGTRFEVTLPTRHATLSRAASR
jgi:signal transduction histidine kinase